MDNQNSKFHLPKIPAIIWIQLLLLAIGYASILLTVYPLA